MGEGGKGRMPGGLKVARSWTKAGRDGSVVAVEVSGSGMEGQGTGCWVWSGARGPCVSMG
jgi:hypothetical protein